MDVTPKSILGGIMALLIPTKVSQLTNDTGFQTTQTINATVVPRYAKQHTTLAGTPDTLVVVWPANRFNSIPIMPDPTVVSADVNFVYKARVMSCDITGCTIKITRQNTTLTVVLGLLSLNAPITAPVVVNVFAIQPTD
jgi:hypothetical protein